MLYFIKKRPIYKKPKWQEMHHAWTGIIGYLISFILMHQFQERSTFFMCFGVFWLWVALDDILQHWLQINEYKEKGYYTIRSFVHWIFYDYIM